MNSFRLLDLGWMGLECVIGIRDCTNGQMTVLIEYSLVSVFYEIIGPCSLDLGWMGLESLCHWSPGLHTNGEWWD